MMKILNTLWRSRWARLARVGRERFGNTAIEFALLAPVLLGIIIGGIEFGRLMWIVSGLNYSAQEGARCYATGLCTATTAATTAAAAAPEMGFTSSNFTASVQTCGYQVAASYQFAWAPSTKIVNVAAPNLSATVCFP